MSNPHIDQVRQSLMDTLADLRNREQPMDIERAKTVAQVASVLVDTAKVENEYLKITGQDKSSFLETQPLETQPTLTLRHDGTPTANNPFPSVLRHTIKG